MSIATMTATLRLNIQEFSEKLKEASKRMSSFAAQTNQDYGKATTALKSHNLGLKDTARIVQGIVVSQTFYTAANSIADATRSLWDFNVALDYMHVTYSALFGDTKVASDFMAALQEHSVETIFDYQNLADASKKLLAYGIEYENLMFIMEGLTNLGAMSGDSAALDRIALALGQIYTKGKLSAEEMRQLANAYIPITEILQDKFGLTGEDLKRVGDLNLPASDVINAIVDYANENFGSVGDAAMYTITGLQNRIVDTLKVAGAQMLKPITNAYKSFLAYLSNGLETLRSEFEAGGVGGIFEYLVPDQQTQQTIRQFIANVRNLFMSLVSIGTVAGQVFGNFASVFVAAFNIVSPLIVGFTNVLASMLHAMLQNRTGAMLLRLAIIAAAGAFVVLKVQALSALVITAVTKAVTGLSKALLLLASIISKHPILSLLAGLAITLVGVSTASSSANKSISSLFDTLSGAGGGASSGDVLQRVEQDLIDGSEAAGQFNNRLNGATDSADELANALGGAGKAADKAAKKTSGLLSFDEVFKLPEPTDSSAGSGGSGIGAGVLDDIGNLMDGLGGLGGALIPDIPDFSEYISDFTDGLFGGLEQGIFDKLATTGIGALIGGGLGAIIGGLLGGPGGALLGAKIGAFAGGFVGLICEAFDGAISNTIAGAVSGMVTTISKALIAAGGAGLGSVIKGAFATGGFSGVFTAIGNVIKTTGLKAIAKGGVIGAAIGLLVDGIAHFLWNGLANRFEGANPETAKVGQTIGSVIGAIIGGLLGGPAGAVIGSAIGTFAAGFAGLFWEPITEYFDPEKNVISKFFVTVGKDLKKWSKDTLKGFTDWWKDSSKGFSNWWKDSSKGFSDWWNDTASGLGTWLVDTVAIFSDWDSINSETLKSWWDNTSEGLSTWWDDTRVGFSEWSRDTLSTVGTWISDTYKKFSTWKSDTKATIDSWKLEALSIIVSFAKDGLSSVTQWVTDVHNKYKEFKENVNTVLTGFAIAAYATLSQSFTDLLTLAKDKLLEIKDEWVNKWNDVKNNLSTWWSDLNSSVEAWFVGTKNTVVNKLVEIRTEWTNKWNEIKNNLSTWWTNLNTSVGTWFGNTKTSVATKLNEISTEWTNKWSTIRSNLSTWFANLPDSISSWFSDTTSTISTTLTSISTTWSSKFNTIKSNLSEWFHSVYASMGTWLRDSITDPITSAFEKLWDKISSPLETVKESIASWWERVKSSFSTISFKAETTSDGGKVSGHATGGVFDREHIARFAEGNKAEAIIPLENNTAMKPFVDAVADGLTGYLAPLVAGSGRSNDLPPLYVGTLIADDRGLKQLYQKFEVIKMQENDRRGLPAF